MMDSYICYQMWHGHRDSLIRAHEFYVREAKARLLTRFENIESEADEAAERALKDNSRWFDPDRHDPSDFYELASEVGQEFYDLLTKMRDDTRLSIISGFFHQWEKSLRQWLADESRKWHRDDNLSIAIWKVKFDDLVELLESWGWALRGERWFSDLNACRMIVNVYKHGDGPSLDALVKNHPQYLPSPLSSFGGLDFVANNNPTHEHLKVDDQDLDEFSAPIVKFWQAVPENVTFGEVKLFPPAWFAKAYNKSATAGATS